MVERGTLIDAPRDSQRTVLETTYVVFVNGGDVSGIYSSFDEAREATPKRNWSIAFLKNGRDPSTGTDYSDHPIFGGDPSLLDEPPLPETVIMRMRGCECAHCSYHRTQDVTRW